VSGEAPESGGGQPPTDPPAAAPQISNATIHIFISYASQDIAVADAIVEALERHGFKCWIAPRDVKAGALYADAIVRAISGAKAFVVVLSENAIASSHVGKEIERASSKKRPIIALRIDAAPLTPALEYFLSESQWVKGQAGNMEAACSRLIDAIREPEQAGPRIIPAAAPASSAATASAGHPKSRRNRILLATGLAVVAAALAALFADKFWPSKHLPASQPVMSNAQETTSRANGAPAGSTPATPAPAAFAPPPHSIAVLPFVNMSGDKEQEYFSDGLTEELLNSLARINELQVAARTSAFSFKGKDTDIGTIARKLNVGAVLEGSVRRSAHTVRITAQLINGVTGFHLWSQTYDRDLGDVLKLQTDIANAVASALKVTLLGDVAAKIELGGTRNPAAFDAYLRGLKADLPRDAKSWQTAIAEYTEAVRQDSNYALAFARRSQALSFYATEFTPDLAARNEDLDKAQTDARHAIALAPSLAEGHLALATFFSIAALDCTQAAQEFERALALSPGDARVLSYYGRFAVQMGRTDAGIIAAQRAVVVDPLNPIIHSHLGQALVDARRYEEALGAYRDFLALAPDDPGAYG
jgi:serine/threonine-protein kinase